jgi:hypothetical protein
MRPARFLKICLGTALVWAASSPIRASEEAAPRRLGVGVNVAGAQVDWRPSEKWMYEARAQAGSGTVDSYASRSIVAGLRLYRFYHTTSVFSPYLGTQGSFIRATQTNGPYRASGASLGLFGGVLLKLGGRLAFAVDAGPYAIILKEKSTNTDQSKVDFVGDSALIFFF